MLRRWIKGLVKSGPEPYVKAGIVDHPNVIQSEQDRYFVGRTGLFPVAAGHEALVLFNTPPESVRRAFVVSITVTSNVGRRAYFIFSAQTEVPLQTSAKVAITHRGAPNEPQAVIQMASGPSMPLRAGDDVFELLLVGGETLVLEQQGRVILEPGEGIGVWFTSITAADEIDVAFGWWEEPLA